MALWEVFGVVRFHCIKEQSFAVPKIHCDHDLLSAMLFCLFPIIRALLSANVLRDGREPVVEFSLL